MSRKPQKSLADYIGTDIEVNPHVMKRAPFLLTLQSLDTHGIIGTVVTISIDNPEGLKEGDIVFLPYCVLRLSSK